MARKAGLKKKRILCMFRSEKTEHLLKMAGEFDLTVILKNNPPFEHEGDSNCQEAKKKILTFLQNSLIEGGEGESLKPENFQLVLVTNEGNMAQKEVVSFLTWLYERGAKMDVRLCMISKAGNMKVLMDIPQ